MLDEAGDSSRPVEPDTVIVKVGPHEFGGAATIAAVATIEPVYVRELPSVATARWVEIIDTADGNRVVTAIEVLSPDNKASGDLNRYREKVKRYLEGGVNVVEIDLLRSTRERLNVPMRDLPPARWADYCTCVNRVSDPDLWAAYPMPLRQPLPTVPIPCREGEPDASLSLQPIIDHIYSEGAYDDIDYTVPPRPPLSPDDAAWAAGVISARTSTI